ncbi:winged helix-turn-helix transcriptional regulator [Pseudonocardia sp. T1-2H]|jgi:DNA-binding HxlR family transcriptional regulator|uniref:winged helix-turn-helix transcriptional regulator n=1 Tax=Pseudonocardia sp. T1-2H TaxID=3128899 RepID=UPI0031015E67
MARYGQYCPITRSLEVLGDRWTLLIIRDLLVGVTRFNELARGLPRLSRGLLSKRLDQLERDGLVVHRDGEYVPTEACEGLRPVVFGLAEWGAQWAFGEPRADELDSTVLMWWMRGGIDAAAFGRPRVVINVLVPDGQRVRYWLVTEHHDVSLCFTDPGFDVDVVIESSLSVLYQVWEGRVPLAAARRDGRVRVSGDRALVRALPSALRFSPVAPYVRRADRARRTVGTPVS